METEMRAYEFLNEQAWTLKALNAKKEDILYRKNDYEQRMKLIPIMYGDRIRQREELELERMRLELEELKADIAATNAKTNSEQTARILDIADAGVKFEQYNKQAVKNNTAAGIKQNRQRCKKPIF
jgi:hypothetical protein